MADLEPSVLPDLPIVHLRWRIGEARVTGVREPLAVGHPLTRLPCIGCSGALGTAEPIAMLVIGPGRDAAARGKAASGGWGTVSAVVVHAACAGADTTATGRAAR